MIAKQIHQRNIKITNTQSKTITNNQTIIDYARHYTQQLNNLHKAMRRINTVQLYQKLMLSFELVGVDGKQTTNSYWNTNKVSSIQ